MALKEWLNEFAPTAKPWSMDALIGILVIFSALLLYRTYTAPAPHNLPVFRVKDNNVVKVLEEAHQSYHDQPFMLSLPGMEMAVLPPSEVETIRTLPETDVSIKKHHYDVFLGEYTYMGTKADEFDSTMRHVLTRNTPAVLASFVAEVDYAVSEQVGECKNWTAVNARRAMSRIASLMSGRAFVGLPLSRDPEWVEATVNYTACVSRAWMVLKLIPWPIRYIAAPFLPEVRSLKAQRATNERKLAPLLREKQGPNVSGEKAGPGGDLLDWYISQYKTTPTVKELGRDQLLATFASIYNLSNALTYVLFDLAATSPEDVEAMRQEVRDVVGAGGNVDKNCLVKLRKLDSFAKESQRLCPPSLVNIPRIVTNPKGLKLSTGHVLPQGTRMTIMSHFINHDPTLYSDPERFDPFRFSRRREIPGNEQKFQHASTGLDNINFGHGLKDGKRELPMFLSAPELGNDATSVTKYSRRTYLGIWACPGRFFANAEIKVILAHLLLHYDIKLKAGTEKPGQQHYGLAILPDATAEVLFKARS